MRHRVSGRKLDRDLKQRKALLKGLATSLVLSGKIVTTTAKAKFVKPYIEKLVTKAKAGADFNTVKYMQDKLDTAVAIETLLKKVAPTFAKRNGGYTRLVKTGTRAGDRAEMSRLEFIVEKAKKATTTRTKKAKVEAPVEGEVVTEEAK